MRDPAPPRNASHLDPAPGRSSSTPEIHAPNRRAMNGSLFSPDTIRAVAEANDIVDVIGSYFPLTRAGRDYKALSPFTTEKTPSFFVNPEKQAFFCFSSGQGGDVFKFLQLYENISFPEAVRKLAERAGLPLETTERSPQEAAAQQLKSRLKALHHEARLFYHHLLMKTAEGEPARAYLKQRGIDQETARNWSLGYAPQDSRPLLQWARDRGFEESLLLEGGLLRRSERNSGVYAHFRHRLMFPVANDYGETVAFSGRILDPDQKGGKYINSPETPIFDKSKLFFGFDKSKQAILKAKHAVLCEGQLDLISAFEGGVENLIAPLGTAFTEHHARLLRRHTEEVVVCFDADRAGRQATDKVFAQLAKAGVLVRVARMPAGDDPDSLVRRDGPEALRQLIDDAVDYFDFRIDVETSGGGPLPIRQRVQLGQHLAEQVALVDDGMKRGLILDRLATRLGISAAELESAAVKSIQNRRHRPAQAGGIQAPTLEEAPISVPSWKVLRDLCRVLLVSPDARDWLRENGDRRLLDDLPDSDLPALLWDGDFDAANSASRSAFLSTLPESAQTAAARVLLEDGPPGEIETARGCQRSMLRKSLENRIAEAKGRLKTAEREATGFEAALKELLDLQSRLKNVRAPFAEERPQGAEG